MMAFQRKIIFLLMCTPAVLSIFPFRKNKLEGVDVKDLNGNSDLENKSLRNVNQPNFVHLQKRSAEVGNGADLDRITAEKTYFEQFENPSEFDENPDMEVYAAASGGRPGSPSEGSRCTQVTSVPDQVRRNMGLSSFYQKYAHAYGIPIISSSIVPDAAIQRACYLVRFMLADRRALRFQMYDKYGRIGIMASTEVTQNIPEHSYLPAFYNQRARGLGGTLSIPISTGAEENVLCYSNDRYRNEDILLHEFSHGIHKISAVSADPTFETRLRNAYNNARRRGLWANTYADDTVDEYFAEGVQSYFNENSESSYGNTPDGIHNHVNTRQELLSYDPTLYGLVREVFPCGNFIINRCSNQNGIHSQNIRMNCDETEGGGNESDESGEGGDTDSEEEEETGGGGSDCLDENVYCSAWASSGECATNPAYMLVNCRRSCNACPPTPGCTDDNARCREWADRGECQRNPNYMLYNCRASCNQC